MLPDLSPTEIFDRLAQFRRAFPRQAESVEYADPGEAFAAVLRHVSTVAPHAVAASGDRGLPYVIQLVSVVVDVHGAPQEWGGGRIEGLAAPARAFVLRERDRLSPSARAPWPRYYTSFKIAAAKSGLDFGWLVRAALVPGGIAGAIRSEAARLTALAEALDRDAVPA
jgi:hypothetical protein